jgi:hypothetical protein
MILNTPSRTAVRLRKRRDYNAERYRMSNFPLGGTPPERFFCELGRVSFAMSGIDTNLDVLLQLLTRAEHFEDLFDLISGETVSWKLARCEQLLGNSGYFDVDDKALLKAILEDIEKLIRERNTLVHLSWSEYDERSRTFYGTRSMRQKKEQKNFRIEEIEAIADSLDTRSHELLDIIADPFFSLLGWP